MPFFKPKHPVHKALSKATKGTLFQGGMSAVERMMAREKQQYKMADKRKEGNTRIKAEKERIKNKYKK